METAQQCRSSLNFLDHVLQNDPLSDTANIFLPIKLINLISLAPKLQ